MFKDNINIYKYSRGLGLKCSICESYNHVAFECPYINYIPNKDRL